MHTYWSFSEGVRVDSLDCKTAFYPAPRLCHPLRLLEREPSSSISLLPLLQHADPHRAPPRGTQTLHALRDRYWLLFNLNMRPALARPGSVKAQNANLATKTTFPGLISKSDATRVPPGREEVKGGRDAARSAPPPKGDPRKQRLEPPP